MLKFRDKLLILWKKCAQWYFQNVPKLKQVP